MYYFITPMTMHDIEPVRAIEQASFQMACTAVTYCKELRDNNKHYVVARASATPPHKHPTTTPPRTPNNTLRSLSTYFTQHVIPAPHHMQQHSHMEQHIVGYAGLWVIVDEGHIINIAVDPAYRGQSIGELLLNSLIDMAFDLFVSEMTLEVRVSNTIAQNLYCKYGFLPVGSRPHYYLDNKEDALIMTTLPIQSQLYQEQLRQQRRKLRQT